MSVGKSELGGWGRGEERDSGWREGETMKYSRFLNKGLS